jgi:hypothetical protein
LFCDEEQSDAQEGLLILGMRAFILIEPILLTP